MIIATANSKNGIPIRLTKERWEHITTSHKEIDINWFVYIILVVRDPDIVLKGDTGELLAVKKEVGKELWIVVAYKEINLDDGFIITAYLTTDSRWLFQREKVWNKQ